MVKDGGHAPQLQHGLQIEPGDSTEDPEFPRLQPKASSFVPWGATVSSGVGRPWALATSGSSCDRERSRFSNLLPHRGGSRCTQTPGGTISSFSLAGTRQTRRTSNPARWAVCMDRSTLGSASPSFVTNITMVFPVPEEGSDDQSLSATGMDGT